VFVPSEYLQGINIRAQAGDQFYSKILRQEKRLQYHNCHSAARKASGNIVGHAAVHHFPAAACQPNAFELLISEGQKTLISTLTRVMQCSKRCQKTIKKFAPFASERTANASVHAGPACSPNNTDSSAGTIRCHHYNHCIVIKGP